MHKYPLFKTDDNSKLRELQSETYGDAVSQIVREARAKHLYAEKLLNTKTTIGNLIRERERDEGERGWSGFTFDHRVVQGVHLYIAGYYRYKTPFLPLYYVDEFDKDRERLKWFEFLEREIRVLTESSIFTRYCLIACLYAHSDQGIFAERIMEFKLIHKYRDMFDSALELEKAQKFILDKNRNWKKELLGCVVCDWEGKYSQSADPNNCKSIREHPCPDCEYTKTLIPLP